MKTILFVTSNGGKARSAEMLLKPYGYRVVQAADRIEEPKNTEDPKIIVDAKISVAAKKHRQPLICEDGGFFVDALGGRPGVRVHEYLDKHGLDGLLKEMNNKRNRKAHFIGVLAYLEPGAQKPVHFVEDVRGTITRRPRGRLKPHSWSALHLVFVPEGESKTIAEMTAREYDNFRDRQDARFKRLGEYLTGKS